VPENIRVPNQSSLSHTWVPNSQNPSISREQNLGRNDSTVANPDCLEFPAQTDSALPKLPKFQHTYDGTTDWSVFIRLFELAARRSRWSEADTCIILLQSLTGKAASILITLPEHLTNGVNYEPLKARLTAIFAATATPAQSRLQLNVRRQRPNESIHDFALAINTLAHSANPSNPKLADEIAVQMFSSGLLDKMLASMLCAVDFPHVLAAEQYALRASFPEVRNSVEASSGPNRSRYDPH